jgi:uncharacterized protein YqhQ
MKTRNNGGQRAEPSILLGGQAVLDGVMMRGPSRIATAVRRTDGTIAVHAEEFAALGARFRTLSLPILRGAVGMVEMLFVGIRALNFSADVAMEGITGLKPPGEKKRGTLALVGAVAFALLLGLLLFFVAPLLITTFFFAVERQPLLFNLTAGIIRMLLFLVYLAAIAQLQDIQRLFAYHGAEHKSVFAYERGCNLSVEDAAMQSRFHPRCGTSFLLIVMLTAIILFAVTDTIILAWTGRISVWLRLAVHLPLVPVIAGLSYELIRLSGKHSKSRWAQWMSAPGLWLQRITTREPDAPQLEVALTALRASLSAGWEAEPALAVDLPAEA